MKIESFNQWRSFIRPRLPGGARLLNPPKINLNEYGFRRFARKPPYFKFKRYRSPTYITNYQSLPFKYNQTIFINYSWEHVNMIHQLKDDIEQQFKGIKVQTIGNDEGIFSIESESGKPLCKVDKDLESTNIISQLFKSLN